MSTPEPNAAADPRLTRWRIVTLLVMVVGYAGCYLCRSNFSVSVNLIAESLVEQGYEPSAAKIALGGIASAAVLAYALCKFVTGSLADFLGGRRNILSGMLGSVLFTVIFALSGTLPMFTLALVGNRVAQSLCWTGIVKVAGRWFSYSSYGLAMGVIALSYLFGDALARWFMGGLFALGLGWRGVYWAAAGGLLTLAVSNFLWLKESPRALGLPEPSDNSSNVFAATGQPSRAATLGQLLLPLLTSPAFIVACLLSLGLTLLRETFNLWAPTYFADTLGASDAEAASHSALFPLLGGVSVLLAGWLGDRLGQHGRAAVMFAGTLATTAALAGLAFVDFSGTSLAPIALVGLVGFLMIGPYSYLSGAISLDLGGKTGGATACGIIDGVGYLGAFMAGDSIARVSAAYGWPGAFKALTAVALLSSLAAGLFLVLERKKMASGVVDEICHLFATKGHAAYVGEPVSQLEHALQAAYHAEQAGASDSLVVAALLHDVGHLIHKLPEDAAEQGIDTRHEKLGQAWLAQHCGPEVTEPVRLHVAAKRYLCATDPEYMAQLSEASVRSLALQGGPFSAEEVRQFEANRWYHDCVALRRWDDLAKVPGMAVPTLEHYRDRLAKVLKPAPPQS